MDLTTYVESAQRQLAVLADPEGDNQAVAERMASALAPTIRLMLLEALSEATEDITLELAPGSVEVRLRGGEPSFAVTSPLAAEPAAPDTEPMEPDGANVVPSDIDDGPMTRINLRLSEQFKGRVEEAAEAEGRSVNAWLVRAAAIVLESRGRGSAARNVTTVGKQRYTGWVR
ncbi:hypothetical protein [Stackebrandtia nassauensis]|nr:hypothetical protein [Stackebrandtia nassauensis]